MGAPVFALTLLLAACAPQRVVPVAKPEPQAQAPVEAPQVPPAESAEAPPSEPVEAGPVKVGLLLPLSGTNAGLGQALLQAAEMALFEKMPKDFELVVRDTEGLGGAAAAAQQLVGEHVELILGPLFGAQVPTAAAAARGAAIPIISFSTDLSVAGPEVYVMGVLPQLQVEREVNYAVSRNYRRFAGLLPDSPFGRTIAGALQASVAEAGATLGQVEFYDPSSPDLHLSIERLAAAKGNFDALLIPEAGERLKLFAQLMQYYAFDQTRMRVLGSALWNDPSLAQQPALVGAWFATPPNAAWDAFQQRYRANYGVPAPRLASIAYDATALAIALAAAGDGPNFHVDVLTQPGGFSGIDGIFRFRPDGGVERGLSIMELQNGRIEIIDPAPASFQPPTS
jgi:ABC-type branched-subunit amino acid transport system substrate-binding protein